MSWRSCRVTRRSSATRCTSSCDSTGPTTSCGASRPSRRRWATSSFPAGEVIYASPAAANRDPQRWGSTADRVVVERADAPQHLQFGAGVHACLGSHLARLQAEIAFDALLARLDDLQLAGDPVWGGRLFIRGLDSLPISCRIRARAS
ncbi:cytochrome P450 [Aquihabitans daechungensis]|uniref:cytochrome P450 n=1 Tax=Aquihabitans daechungensis TaxID=1052257 RepID=UPI003B9FDFC7